MLNKCWNTACPQKVFFAKERRHPTSAVPVPGIAWPFIKVHQQIIDYFGGRQIWQAPWRSGFPALDGHAIHLTEDSGAFGRGTTGTAPLRLVVRVRICWKIRKTKVETLKLSICRQGTPIQKCASELSICTAGFHWWYLSRKGSATLSAILSLCTPGGLRLQISSSYHLSPDVPCAKNIWNISFIFNFFKERRSVKGSPILSLGKNTRRQKTRAGCE